MGMTNDGLCSWQAESEGIELLDTTIGDLLDRRAICPGGPCSCLVLPKRV